MEKNFHIVMYPWFAMGHLTPFLHLANHLAKRGHKTTLLLPHKAKLQLDSSNHHPSLITLQPISVPHVDPLPIGTETATEIPIHLATHLATAMDLTRPEFESIISSSSSMHVDFIFYDFSPWVPEVGAKHGIKTLCFSAVSASALAIALVPEAYDTVHNPVINEHDVAQTSNGYPSETVVFKGYEAENLKTFLEVEFGSGISFYERSVKVMTSCDAIAVRTIAEIESSFCDYISKQFNKPVFLTGPVLPESGSNKEDLDPKWVEWLGGFGLGSVVFCAFGSQIVLEKDQFQELMLGFEMTDLPFLVAVKPPIGCATVHEALPDGFNERVKERGVVHGGWVQQPQILAHESIGCFVNHCGFGSMWEALMSKSQIVLIPQLGDQILNTRLMAKDLKVAVEVEKEKNGWVKKERLCNAIRLVMDEGNEVGNLVRKNHSKWRETLISPGFMSVYVDNFINNLQRLT